MKEAKDKSKQGLAVIIIVLAYYALIHVLGLVGYFTDSFAGIAQQLGVAKGIERFGIDPKEACVAYAQTYSFLLIVMLPSVFYYVATQQRFRLPKAVRIFLFVVGIAATLILTFAYFKVCNRFNHIFTAADYTFPQPSFILRLSVIVGDVGFLIINLLPVMVRSIESIRNKIVRTVVWVTKMDFFRLLLIVALTLFLIPLALILMMLVLILIAVLIFAAIAGGGRSGSSSEPVYIVYDGGFERALKYYDRYNGINRYRDDLGNFWYSDDGGKTFYKS